MADTQMVGLMQMMEVIASEESCKIYLTPIKIKKKFLKVLEKGDIVLLEKYKLDVILVQNNRILGYGEYGLLDSVPSILIDESVQCKNIFLDDVPSGRIDLLLGTVDKADFQKRQISPVYKKRDFDVVLLRENRVIAEASLVQIDGLVALQIEEVN